MIKQNNIAWISYVILFTLLQACSGDKPKYILDLHDTATVNYGATSQAISRVYKATLKRRTEAQGDISILNSQENTGLAVLIIPNSGGKVAEFDIINDTQNKELEFKDTLALSTNREGDVYFMWEAGTLMGQQNVNLELVSVVRPTTATKDQYIPIELSNIELQDNTPVGQLRKLHFKADIVEKGMTTDVYGNPMPVGVIGSQQSGFKQVWTLKNLSNPNAVGNEIPNSDPSLLEEFGSLYSLPVTSSSLCPEDYLLPDEYLLECLQDYLNDNKDIDPSASQSRSICLLRYPPFDLDEHQAGFVGYLGANGPLVNLEYHPNRLRIWSSTTRYAMRYFSCMELISGRYPDEKYSIRCIKTNYQCPSE